MQGDQWLLSQMNRGFKSIRRQRSSLPLIIMNVSKFWRLLSGSIFPMQIGRVEANKHSKKMVTLHNDILNLKNYLRWNVFAVCRMRFFLIRTYLTHLQTEFHIPCLTTWRLISLRVIYENLVCASHKSQFVGITQWVLYREIFTVYSNNHTDQINTMCGQHAEFLVLSLAVGIPTASLQKTIHLLLL
jgi:hypothetical protein